LFSENDRFILFSYCPNPTFSSIYKSDEKVALGTNNCAQSFTPLLNQGAKDKPCVAKIQIIFAPQL